MRSDARRDPSLKAEPTDTSPEAAATGPYQPDPGSPALARVGRYELRQLLGEGAFGRVYRAYDPRLDREVALKVPRFAPDEAPLVERFLREARAAARLRHPGIVPVFDADQADGRLYIAAELVTGQPLSERVAAERPSLRQAVEWVRSLALALHYAHEQGIVHRDVKPANIMVNSHGRVQLMDFGLAKRVEDGDLIAVIDDEQPDRPGALRTAVGAVVGTPAYMAPEQARGQTDLVGPLSDEYSLGVVLYELLTGVRPFRGKLDELRRLVADTELAAEPPQTHNPEIPPALAAVCLKAIAKSPNQRYATLADFAVDLQRWLKGQSVRAYRPPKKARRNWLVEVRRHARSLLLGGASLAVLLAGGTMIVVLAVQLRQASRRQEEVLRQAAEQIEEQQRGQEQAAQKLHREILVRECDLYRERGLRLRGERKLAEALLWLTRSYATALDIADEERERQAVVALSEGEWQLRPPSGIDARGWRLAGNLLLKLSLPDEADDIEVFGERLEHSGAARFTAYGGGRVLTADEPTSREVGSGRSRRHVTDPHQYRDAHTGKAFSDPMPGYENVVFSPDGRRAVRLQSIWTVWDLESGQSLGPKHEKDWVVQKLAFNPDGSRLVIYWEGKASIINPLTMETIHKEMVFPGMEGWRPQMALSPDGELLACYSDSSLNMWRVGATRGTVIQQQERGRISTVAFHPDGRRLAIATEKGIDLFDLTARRQSKWLPVTNAQQVQFSPDGQQVLTLSPEGVGLWDVGLCRPSGLPLDRLKGVKRVQFRPDGQEILTAADKDARLWPNPSASSRGKAAMMWAEVTTRMELMPSGTARELEEATLKERIGQLKEATGIRPR